MKKKTIGYIYKLSHESWEDVLSLYKDTGFSKSKKRVLKEIQVDMNSGRISKKSKPRLSKVIV